MTYRDKGYLDILVIEDDPALLDLISAVLRADGHQVIAADSAERGLEQLPYFTFEVAFLDHQLPGMEGLVLGEYLRQNNPNMEITLVTGAADDRLRRLAEVHGIQVLAKPFEVDQLLDVVALYLAGEDARESAATVRQTGGIDADLAAHWEALPEAFGAPNVPHRLEELLARRVRQALDNLRFDGPEPARDRVVAYAGLIAAQVLGLHLPRQKDGQTLFAAYDERMRELGRAPAFSVAAPDRPDAG